MTSDELTCGERLPAEAYAAIIQRAIVESAQWNVAEGGGRGLCDFPLLLGPTLYADLRRLAVALESEARAAEDELLARPELHGRLGLPRALRHALREHRPSRGPRFARVDFHPLAGGGFAITECNVDVAGGFNESSIAALFAEHGAAGTPGGDPASALAAAVLAEVGEGATVGCLHLTNFTDDHQVARFVGRAFERVGLVPVLFGPSQLRWEGPRACARIGQRLVPLAAVFRFFPADWLPKLDPASRWEQVFCSGPTSWVNPPSTLLTQSKRFPLVWPDLASPLATWKALLPETRNPWRARGPAWVLKPAFAHEGYRIGMPGVTRPQTLRGIWLESRFRAGRWVAQRRFAAAALDTPVGPRFPCVGVYVVDGKAAGLYGRLAPHPLIDDTARNVVILVREP